MFGGDEAHDLVNRKRATPAKQSRLFFQRSRAREFDHTFEELFGADDPIVQRIVEWIDDSLLQTPFDEAVVPPNSEDQPDHKSS